MPETIRVGLHCIDAPHIDPNEVPKVSKDVWLGVDDPDPDSADRCKNGFVAEYRFVRLLKVTTETKTITTVEEVQ